jgi:hypothetical protein
MNDAFMDGLFGCTICWCKKYWLILYTRFQRVFPMSLGSYGPKRKWPRAQDKTLRMYPKKWSRDPRPRNHFWFSSRPKPKLSVVRSSRAGPFWNSVRKMCRTLQESKNSLIMCLGPLHTKAESPCPMTFKNPMTNGFLVCKLTSH